MPRSSTDPHPEYLELACFPLVQISTVLAYIILPNRGGLSSCMVYCSTPVGLNLANSETFTGGLSLLKKYRSSTCQFELKIVEASDILPQERKSFHLFLVKYLNVDLKIELFLLQRIWPFLSCLNLLTPARRFLELYTVETGSLFDVFFRGRKPKWKARPIG